MKVYTENSIYEFNKDTRMVRRLAVHPSPLRPDGEWLKYVGLHYEVGEPMHLVTEHIGGEPGAVNMRTTTVVLKVED